MGSVKRRVFEILEVAGPEDSLSRYFDIFIVTLIVLNIIAIVLESIEYCALRYEYYFTIFEGRIRHNIHCRIYIARVDMHRKPAIQISNPWACEIYAHTTSHDRPPSYTPVLYALYAA